MTSRTGHVMSTGRLQPVEERLREIQRLVSAASAVRADVVNGQSPTTTRSTLTAVDSYNNEVVLPTFRDGLKCGAERFKVSVRFRVRFRAIPSPSPNPNSNQFY